MEAKMKRLIAMFLVFSMMLLLVHSTDTGLASNDVKTFSDEYKLIGENDQYNLYMNETYLSIIMEDKTTGAIMESAVSYDDGKNNNTWVGAMQSAVVLSLIYQNVDTKQADLVNDNVHKTITYSDNGFTAKLYWPEYELGLSLQVTLEEDGLVATIPDESIIEDGDTYYIGTVMIYPYMGSSYLDDKDGYMFVPDGNGALINLDNKEGRFSSAYSNMIYGEDIGFIESDVEALLWDRYKMINESEDIIAPIYGMAYTDDEIAYLAVVEEGAMRAKIEASPNGVSIDYNRIFARFIERKLYTQPTSNNSSTGSIKLVETDRSHSDLTIRYLFLSKDQANYTGMANAYRNYLLDNGGLSVKDDTYRTRVDFLGTDREDWIFGTSAVVMTTVEDIKVIYSDLESEDVTNLFSVYKGWQKGGLYNIPITSYKADRKIGGTGDLTALIQDSEENGSKLYLYNDGLQINPDEKNATFNVVKLINKRKYELNTYKDVYDTFLYLTPFRSETLIDRMVASYTKKDVDNLALAGITSNLFSWSYGGDVYSRFDCATQYKVIASKVDEQTELVLEAPQAYLWNYTDAFLDMPLAISDYIYEDESVPFLSIVLKGVVPMYSDYVNFEANKQEYFLKLVETGTYPSFYITKESSSELIYTNSNDIYSSEYSVFKDLIVEYDKQLKGINEMVKGSLIVGHEILDNEVRIITYDNGIKIYVNYSDRSQNCERCYSFPNGLQGGE